MMAETDTGTVPEQGKEILMPFEGERSSSGDGGSVVTLDPDTMVDQSNGTAEDTGTSTMRHRVVTSTVEVPSVSEVKRAQLRDHPQTAPRNPRFAIRAATPTHRRLKESPLSSSAIFHESHAGLFNLCIVVLVAVNGRLIIENLMKYGLLMRKEFWLSSHSPRDFPLLICGLTLPIFPLLSFVVEKWKAARPRTNEKVVALLHCIIATVAFAYPAYIIHIAQSAPLGGFLLILNTVIVWMKLVSYAHTNYDMRLLLASGEQPPPAADTAPTVRYPDNINLSDLAYFMAAPTLCYQLGYPRSPTIRKYWILRQVMKLVVFLGLILFIIEQYINPTIKNSHHPMKGHLVYSIERVLKLSIPTLYVWLCVFYCLFHLWLNIVAEVLRFGDREFYKDWWNATTIEEYWRSWNMPVHRWMVRHVYYPCLGLGCSKSLAVFVVFLLSAIFHEVLVGLPCHMLRMWAFMGIIFQIPLVVLTNCLLDKYKQPMVGNMLFWFFFCIVGQPTCLLLYYHDVQVQAQ